MTKSNPSVEHIFSRVRNEIGDIVSGRPKRKPVTPQKVVAVTIFLVGFAVVMAVKLFALMKLHRSEWVFVVITFIIIVLALLSSLFLALRLGRPRSQGNDHARNP